MLYTYNINHIQNSRALMIGYIIYIFSVYIRFYTYVYIDAEPVIFVLQSKTSIYSLVNTHLY